MFTKDTDWEGLGCLQRYILSLLLLETFPFARSIYSICTFPTRQRGFRHGGDFKIKHAGTFSVHITDGSLFIPTVRLVARIKHTEHKADVSLWYNFRMRYLKQFVIGRSFSELICLVHQHPREHETVPAQQPFQIP